ncbi:MAG: flippase-like domain-containing protein [Saprospiraceae bacterium]|nr:flippase-like domain-containing protein [Saprospiraceae bacterium]
MGRLDKLLPRFVPVICLGVLGNLAYAWFATDRSRLSAANFSFGWMLVAMLLALLPWVWHAIRLAIWSRFFGVDIAWRQFLRIAIATDVGGVAMPAAVGGAPFKAAMLVQQGYRPGQAATLTLWGSLEDVFFYVVAIPISLSLTHNWDNPLWQHAGHFLHGHRLEAVALLMGLWAVGFLAFRFFKKNGGRPRWGEKMQRTWREFQISFSLIFTKGRKPFIWSSLAIAAQWLTRFCILLAVVRMLGLEADWVRLLLLQWMVFVAMMLTPTPGATGGAEAGFLLIFTGCFPEGMANLVMLAWRFSTYYFMLGTGAVCLGLATKIPTPTKHQ